MSLFIAYICRLLHSALFVPYNWVIVNVTFDMIKNCPGNCQKQTVYLLQKLKIILNCYFLWFWHFSKVFGWHLNQFFFSKKTLEKTKTRLIIKCSVKLSHHFSWFADKTINQQKFFNWLYALIFSLADATTWSTLTNESVLFRY